MHEFLPILIVGAIIGVFTVLFLTAYALEKNKKETMGFDRNMADSEIIRRLLAYAKPYWKQFVLTGLVMLFSVVYDVVSPLLVGKIVGMVQEDFELRELFAMVAVYGSILVVSLICTYAQAIPSCWYSPASLPSEPVRCRAVSIRSLPAAPSIPSSRKADGSTVPCTPVPPSASRLVQLPEPRLPAG